VEAWSSGGGEDDGASRHSQRTFSIGLGLRHRWGTCGYSEPRTLRPGPYLPLYSAVRRGSISQENGWTPLDQGTDQEPNWPLDQPVEINLIKNIVR